MPPEKRFLINLSIVSDISRPSGTAVHTAAFKKPPGLFRFDETSVMPALAGFDVRIRPPRGYHIGRVCEAPSGKALRVRKTGRGACVTVRYLRVHKIIVAEYPKGARR